MNKLCLVNSWLQLLTPRVWKEQSSVPRKTLKSLYKLSSGNFLLVPFHLSFFSPFPHQIERSSPFLLLLLDWTLARKYLKWDVNSPWLQCLHCCGARSALDGTEDSWPVKVMTRGAGDAMGPDGANQILTLSLTDMEISLSGDDADSNTKAKHRVWIFTLVVSKGLAAKITALNLYLLT